MSKPNPFLQRSESSKELSEECEMLVEKFRMLSDDRDSLKKQFEKDYARLSEEMDALTRKITGTMFSQE